MPRKPPAPVGRGARTPMLPQMNDAPLAGLAFFGGWIVLLVASDIAALLKMSNRRASQVQSGLLLGSIAAALAFGTTVYVGSRGHARSACAPRHAASVSARTSHTNAT